MFYNTPDVRKYVDNVIKYRFGIIFFYLLVVGLILVWHRPEFVSSDELFWLNESKALAKTNSKSYETSYLSRLTLYLNKFDEEALSQINNIVSTIQKKKGVKAVESLLTSKQIYKHKDSEESSLIKALPISHLNAAEIKAIVSKLPQHYANFVEPNFLSLHFYIHSDIPVSLQKEEIGFSYFYSQPNYHATWIDYAIYSFAIIVSVLLLFKLLFHNFFSGIIALVIMFITFLVTMILAFLVTGLNALHLGMVLMVISISLVDYLYFYYRWHVSQYKADLTRAMQKTINRNLYPALWTSVITIVGLGGLLFVDSAIIGYLSISVIGASTMTYILNVTLLPALLSFFSIKHPKVSFGRLGTIFSHTVVNYKPRTLVIFLAISLIVMGFGGYKFLQNSAELFSNSEKSGVITAKLPLYELDVSLVKNLCDFEKTLKKRFSDSVKVESIGSLIDTLHKANYASQPLTQSYLMEAMMYLELYGLENSMLQEDALNITITFNTNTVNKSELLNWIEHKSDFELFLTDMDSLMNRAKEDSTMILAMSLIFALILIGFIMSIIFRSKEMVVVGFIVNSLPMIWFGFIIHLLDFPLTIEALIAMTMALGLGSDATVHFAYKYWRSRYFGRTQKHSLDIMFFYAGIPVIIGSIILGVVFVSLTFTNLYTLQLIGGYGALLIVLSLITDILILPVMLLTHDKFYKVI